MYKRTHIDKETNAKVVTIYQDNGWEVEHWIYPDGTEEEIYNAPKI